MHGEILRNVAHARHADLMREAAQARRVAAARRSRTSPLATWSRRIGALVSRLGSTRRGVVAPTPDVSHARTR